MKNAIIASAVAAALSLSAAPAFAQSGDVTFTGGIALTGGLVRGFAGFGAGMTMVPLRGYGGISMEQLQQDLTAMFEKIQSFRTLYHQCITLTYDVVCFIPEGSICSTSVW